ncbi:MAG: arylsulfatase [Planctomycetes bacterium]|nr:arylsulfatase [Planctomycetota bacterium]
MAGDGPPARPNIVLIVADDLGYSDLGCFGGEIKTPNLDAMAARGVRFTNFCTGASCSPSRSMLLSGTDSHLAGLGNMDEWTAPNQRGVPGYEGYLNKQVVTFASLLHDSGYHTYMVGKWHLGKQPDLIPAARGFERDFSLLDGAGSYWDMTGLGVTAPRSTFTEDGKYIDKLPSDYYATKTYTDKMIGFIDAHRGDGKPFFAYVAHQAPHDPYALPDDWLRRYEGKFDAGWDELRIRRLSRMSEMGIMPADATLAERLWYVPFWSDLAPIARVLVSRKMALYAGMVENLDYHVGRLVEHLKKIGEYDNTLFIFMSDNGAEGTDVARMIAGTPGTRDYLFHVKNWSRNDPNAWGRPGSNVTYGPGWAQVSMTPFRQYKGWLTEGGIHLPLIVAGAGVQREAGSLNNSLVHVMDIAPTALEMAGVDHPATYDGREVARMQGKSWAPMLAGRTNSARGENDWIGWEMWGSRAIRRGDWKLLWQPKPMGNASWELYNLAKDPGEREDVSSANPQIFNELLAHWDEYVKTNNVILPSRTPFESLEDQLPMRIPVDEGYPPVKFKTPFVPPRESAPKSKGSER